jgi:hypothetical protein
MDAPSSSADALTSLTDYRRRMKSDVVVVMDEFDEAGRVAERTRGAVWRQPGTSIWIGEPTRGDKNQATWVPRPQLASDCEISGPTLTYAPGGHALWRLTIIDESHAGPTVEREAQPRQPRPSRATFNHLRERLGDLTETYNPRYRWFSNPGGPLFCWTTQADADGRYLSFAAEQVGSGARKGVSSLYRLAEDSVSRHKLRRDAKDRAIRQRDRYKAGEQSPWR